MQWEDSQEKMASDNPLENLKNSKMLRQKGKRATASTIHQELSANGHSETLNVMLDDLLSPDKDINDSDNIEWCKWIIASGKSPNDFSSQGMRKFFHLFCTSCSYKWRVIDNEKRNKHLLILYTYS